MKNIIFIILFCVSVLSAQNNFFKYSTFYTSMSTGTSFIEDQDYIAVVISILSRISGLDTLEIAVSPKSNTQITKE